MLFKRNTFYVSKCPTSVEISA